MLRKSRNWSRMSNIQLTGLPERKKRENRELEIITQADKTFLHSLSATERPPQVPDTWMNGIHIEWDHRESLEHQSKEKILKTFSEENQFTHLQIKKAKLQWVFSAMNMETTRLLNTPSKFWGKWFSTAIFYPANPSIKCLRFQKVYFPSIFSQEAIKDLLTKSGE